MVRRSWSTSRETGRQETLLDTSRMGCGKTRNERKTREDRVEEVEAEVARKSIRKEISKLK